jgi:hypothetical protein
MTVICIEAKMFSVPRDTMNSGRFYIGCYVGVVQQRDNWAFAWYFSHERKWLVDNNIEHTYYGGGSDADTPLYWINIPARSWAKNRVAVTKLMLTHNATVTEKICPPSSSARRRHRLAERAYLHVTHQADGWQQNKHNWHVSALGSYPAGRKRLDKIRRCYV